MTGSFDVGRGTVGVIVSGSMKVWGRAVVTRGVVGLDVRSGVNVWYLIRI